MQKASNSLSSVRRLSRIVELIKTLRISEGKQKAEIMDQIICDKYSVSMFKQDSEAYQYILSNLNSIPVEILLIWFLYAENLTTKTVLEISSIFEKIIPKQHPQESNWFFAWHGALSSFTYHYHRIYHLTPEALVNFLKLYPENVLRLNDFLDKPDELFREALQLGIDTHDYLRILQNNKFTLSKRKITADVFLKKGTHSWIILDDMFNATSDISNCDNQIVLLLFYIKHEVIDKIIEFISRIHYHELINIVRYIPADFVEKFHSHFALLTDSKKAVLLKIPEIHKSTIYEDIITSYLKSRFMLNHLKDITIPDNVIQLIKLPWAENAVKKILTHNMKCNKKLLKQKIMTYALVKPKLLNFCKMI